MVAPIKNPIEKWFFGHFAAVIPALYGLRLAVQYAIKPDAVPYTWQYDVVRSASEVALLLAFLMGSRFLTSISPTLAALAANKVMRPREPTEDQAPHSKVLLEGRLERWLNHRARMAFGTIAAVTTAIYYWQKGSFTRTASFDGPLEFLDFALYLVPIAYMYFLGVLAWKMFVTSAFFGSATRTYWIAPRFLHPDHSCGFAAVGELCMRISYVAVVPALVSRVFLLWPFIPPLSQYGEPNETLRVFARGILCAGIVALMLGWRVLWRFHKAILDHMDQWQIELAKLADRLIAEKETIVRLAASAESEVVTARLKQMSELQQLYDASRQVRTWPIDRAKAVRLWGSIVILAGQVAAVMQTLPRILGSLGGS